MYLQSYDGLVQNLPKICQILNKAIITLQIQRLKRQKLSDP
jgi:hypothetical protein